MKSSSSCCPLVFAIILLATLHLGRFEGIFTLTPPLILYYLLVALESTRSSRSFLACLRLHLRWTEKAGLRLDKRKGRSSLPAGSYYLTISAEPYIIS